MLKKTVSGLTAQKLRLLLVGSIALLIIIAAAVFTLARSVLAGYTADVQRISIDAASSSENLAALNSLKVKLDADKEAVERAKSLVAESKSYAYQDQIIKDISTYASKAGVEISGFQFNEAAAGGATPAAGAAATPAPAAGATGTAGGTPAVSGLKTVSVSVNLKSPLTYNKIINFVHHIEQNLTKMQLAGISLSKDSSSSDITASALTIEVYVR